MDAEYRWLPHLEDAVPSAGQGKRISTYTVALEGWRRGLKLKFYSIFEDGNKLKVRYSLSSENKTHHFSLSMGDKVSEEAFEICNDKDLTKQYLHQHNVPVPMGEMFEEDVKEEDIIEYGLSLGFPLVVKPTDGNAGKGVFANITNEKDLREIVPYVRNELDFSNIIVEKYVAGEEFRIFVIEDKVLGAMNRRPANVIGDGVLTIRQLIEQKNKIRKINPHLTSRLIKIDKEVENLLEEKGYTLNTIPKKGELVYLREKSNLSTGGDAIDVTEQLTPQIEKIAIDAGKAIPGLKHFGVDMIVNDDRTTGVILEVNTRPGIGGHLFPGEGKPRDFAKDIIDYYFPETKDVERTNLYFDFDSVLEPIKSRTTRSVEVIQPPLEKLYGKKYIINGDFHRRKLRNFVRRQALKLYMHGFTEITEDNKVLLVAVSTEERNFIKFERNLIKDFNIENIEDAIWDKPVKMGFETRDNLNLTKKEIQNLLSEKEQLERENDRLQKRYHQILTSRAWRATYPLRSLLHNIKIRIRSMNSNEK